MSSERGPLREISWRDVFPWLIIFRTFRISIGIQVLFLASIGATATTAGWVLSDALFVREADHDADPSFMTLVDANNKWPWQSANTSATGQEERAAGALGILSASTNIIPDFVTQRFVKPFKQVFQVDVTFVKSAYFLFGGFWSLAVWAFFAAAITRIAVMRLGCEERVGLKEALRHACRKFGSYLAAPAMPLIAIVILTVPLALLGLLMKLDVGVVIAGFLWLLVVLDGLVMGVLLIGLVFGWPLMWGTISAEGSDSFDALSRSYNYTLQRPLHYLFYVLVASVFGVLCFFLVSQFSQLVINLGYWGVSWGTGNERVTDILAMAEQGAERDGTLGFGASVISFFTGFVRLLVGGFSYAFFWCVASAIYLLLRYNVDQTEFDEVWLEEHEQRYELPELKPDEAGVPQLDKEQPQDEEAPEQTSTDAESTSDKSAETESTEADSQPREDTETTTADSPEPDDARSDEADDNSDSDDSSDYESKPNSN